MLLSQLSSSHSKNIMEYTALGAWWSHSTHLPSLHDREESSFPGLALPSDTVNSESVVAIQPVDSCVVTDIRLMSLLTPGMQSSLSLIHMFTLSLWVRCHPLAIFLLNLGVRIIHFWTKQLQDLNTALIPS